MSFKQEEARHEHSSDASNGDKASLDSSTLPSGAVHCQRGGLKAHLQED